MAAFLGAALLVAPFFRARGAAVPKTHDMDQHLAAFEDFHQGLRAGNLYPRWQAGFNWGYGLPWLNFYTPGFYYLAEPFALAGHESSEAFLAASLLAMAASGVSFFWFARLFYATTPAALGALFYMAAPYHLLDLYVRGAFPEFTGFVFAPLIFGTAYLTCRSGRPRHYAAMAVAIGCFMFTHLPTAYLTMIALSFYVVVWTALERDWRILARMAVSTGLAMLLSAIYWIPAALETDYVDQSYTNVFPYFTSYLPYMKAGDEVAHLLDKAFFVALAQTIAAIILLSAIAWPVRKAAESKSQRRKKSAEPLPDAARESAPAAATRLHTRLLLATACFSLFLITDLSESISRLIPKIVQVVSFPWRGMLPVSFLVAAGVVAVLHRLRQRSESKAARWGYWFGVAWLVLYYAFAGVEIVSYELRQPNLSRVPFYADGVFYPRGATPPYRLSNSPAAMLTSGQGHATVLRWKPFLREVAVTASSPAVVRLRTYNFPGWTAAVDGRATTIESDPDGVQTVAVPAGDHRIEITFRSTGLQKAGAAISALGVLAILALLLATSAARITKKPSA